jgi:carbon storage regulator
MLILTRRIGESIRIAEGITVTVLRIGQSQVRLGVEAPREIPIVRTELETAAVGEAA